MIHLNINLKNKKLLITKIITIMNKKLLLVCKLVFTKLVTKI